MSNLASKLIGPAGLVILICFFLPWITVSCGGITAIDGASALDIAGGIKVENESMESTPELYLVLAGAIVMVAAGARLWGNRSGMASAAALLGTLLVLGIAYLFRAGVMEEIQKAASQGFVLQVQWEGGYWGAFTGGLAGAVASLLSFGRTSEAVSKPVRPAYSESTPQQDLAAVPSTEEKH